MKRYTLKKWWSLKEDPMGQYVAFQDVQSELENLNEKNQQLRNDIERLWEALIEKTNKIKELQIEVKELEEDCEYWNERTLYWDTNYKLENSYRRRYANKNKQLAWSIVVLLGLLILPLMV